MKGFTYNKPHRSDQPTESIPGYVSVRISNLESDYKTVHSCTSAVVLFKKTQFKHGYNERTR